MLKGLKFGLVEKQQVPNDVPGLSNTVEFHIAFETGGSHDEYNIQDRVLKMGSGSEQVAHQLLFWSGSRTHGNMTVMTKSPAIALQMIANQSWTPGISNGQ